MSKRQTPESFLARVNQGPVDSCWDWAGSCNSTGYGSISWNGRVVVAHRVAYHLANREIDLLTGFREPGRAKQYGEFVLHQCDNKRCCNPAHLRLGTMQQNQMEAYARRRRAQPRSKHSNARLPPDAVREIRRLYTAGYTQQALAQQYGVRQTTISKVVRGKTYIDV
jgi:hypothetical protein